MEQKDQTALMSELLKIAKDELFEMFYTDNEDQTEDKELKNQLNHISDILAKKIFDRTLNISLRERLSILYDYEKRNLDLLKEYKEEIKFAAALQEDLRKERAKFFSETLKDVSCTLKETQVETTVVNMWIKELVSSYTKSLDLSSELAKEQTVDIVNELKKESKKEVGKNVEDDNIKLS